MSCVIGIKQDGKIYIGADSCAHGDFYHTLTEESGKIARVGSMLIGSVWSPRPFQILRYVFQPVEFVKGSNPIEYLVREFALPYRDLLKENGAIFDPDNDKSGDMAAQQLLIALDGRLFILYSNFQVCEHVDEFIAIGSGAPFALGALHTAQFLELPAKHKIELAMAAAARFEAEVRPPIYIETL